ncbi:hypothetical protein [Caulobacter sp. RL271]|uniref:Uncharacterized protein n=1 Tax=Caulobacter segnis TaxID=88688 RepID=A0ABY4ZX17_9CAUL|nr:hypothetical protein [Caulobacter segnis]USQ96522.1 hypothetical protein MZV50_02705 [Caulobacter segnis]
MLLFYAADQTIPKSAATPQPWPAATCPSSAKGELIPFEQVPLEVLADLRRVDPKISPPGGPFNPSDVIDGTTPGTRIIAVMRLGDRLAAAYEKGGRGYSVTVVTYVQDPATKHLVASGLHTLSGRDTPRGWVKDEDACAAMVRALSAGG